MLWSWTVPWFETFGPVFRIASRFVLQFTQVGSKSGWGLLVPVPAFKLVTCAGISYVGLEVQLAQLPARSLSSSLGPLSYFSSSLLPFSEPFQYYTLSC